MKQVISFLLFALIAFLPNNMCAGRKHNPTNGELFKRGLAVGAIPGIGQAIVAMSMLMGISSSGTDGIQCPTIDDCKKNGCFFAGFALGTAAWAVPSYLVYRHFCK